MNHFSVPVFCKPCIQKLQAQCSHNNIVTTGGYHFSAGDVWDDITDVCLDCGAEPPIFTDSPYQADMGDLFPEEIPF
jgi:hypothetical protein